MRTLIAALALLVCVLCAAPANATTFAPDKLYGGISRQVSSEGEIFINVYNESVSTSKIMFARFALPSGMRTDGDVVVPGGMGACNAPDDHTMYCRDMHWRSETTFGIAFHTSPPLTDNQGLDLYVSVNGVSELGPYKLTGPATDKLLCGGHYPFVVGTSGADRFVGTPGPDIFVGAGGNDVILGKAGNDILCGDGGADTVNGGTGNDEIYGGAGADALLGLGGADWMSGEAGNDSVDGGQGSDIAHGGAGRDMVRGGADGDQLFGNAGRDRLLGGGGSDSCAGGAQKDSFSGCEAKQQ